MCCLIHLAIKRVPSRLEVVLPLLLVRVNLVLFINHSLFIVWTLDIETELDIVLRAKYLHFFVIDKIDDQATQYHI